METNHRADFKLKIHKFLNKAGAPTLTKRVCK